LKVKASAAKECAQTEKPLGLGNRDSSLAQEGQLNGTMVSNEWISPNWRLKP
jgi:hypothetical protein